MISLIKTLDLKVFIGAEVEEVKGWEGGSGLCDLCGAFKVGQLTNDWLQKNVEDHDWMKVEMKMNELNLLVAKS